ncbi:MAG: NAD-dependent deacylase, partial [Chloroflexota bacterium]
MIESAGNGGNYAAEIEHAAQLLTNSQFTVALTGAGISTPSGIPDFRSPASGLWDKHNPMEVAHISAFKQRPEDFYDWIRPLVKITNQAEPNPAHNALAQLEQNGPLRAIITQNIDGLHTRAGSETVYEVHGHTKDVECLACGYSEPAEQHMIQLSEKGQVPMCKMCDRVMKPKVVLFGELLPRQVMASAEHAVTQADVMIIAGSSLEVAPVSELPWRAHAGGAKLIIINYQPTYADSMADVIIRDDVASALPAIYSAFS